VKEQKSELLQGLNAPREVSKGLWNAMAPVSANTNSMKFEFFPYLNSLGLAVVENLIYCET
jgi:hypothetical protein